MPASNTMIDVSYHPLVVLLRHFTYKPGWSFKWRFDDPILILYITANVIDADNPEQECQIMHSHSFDLSFNHANEDFWMKFLRSIIITMETHEVDEFFQIEGVKVFDPHA